MKMSNSPGGASERNAPHVIPVREAFAQPLPGLWLCVHGSGSLRHRLISGSPPGFTPEICESFCAPGAIPYFAAIDLPQRIHTTAPMSSLPFP